MDPTSFGDSEEEKEVLERRLAEPTLWDAFCRLLSSRGLPMPPEDEETRRASLLAMAREPEHRELFALSEALLDHDELFVLWRQKHVVLAERQIGRKRGTAGSSGASFLKATLEKRFFPELWDLRSHL